MAGIMDTINGFFGHAPNSTLMDRITSPIVMGLGGVSQGLASGGGFGAGLRGFTQGAMQAGQIQQQKKLLGRADQQYESEQADAQKKAAAEQAKAAAAQRIQDAMAQGQKPSVADLFTLDPQAFAKQQIDAQNPKPKDGFTLGTARYEYGPDGKPQLVAQGPREPKEAPETWGPMTPEQATAYGLPTNKGFRVSTRGQVQQIGGSSSEEPMVEVYDPNSATGTSYVPRSQAAGRAGKPSNGITIGADGTVQIGGSGGPKATAGYEPDPALPGALRPIKNGPADPNTPTSATVAKQQAAQMAFENLDGTLARLTELVDKYGTEFMPGEVKSEMESLQGDALLQYKEVNALGALTGPDMPLMESIIGDPTSLSANIGSLNPFAGNPAKKKLEVFKKLLDRSRKNSASVLQGGRVDPPAGGGTITPPTLQAPGTAAAPEIDDLFKQFGM